MNHSDQYSLSEKLYEMRLHDIYKKYPWIGDEISLEDFIKLFPISYKKGRALVPDKPVSFDLDREIFLEILVAFKQSF